MTTVAFTSSDSKERSLKLLREFLEKFERDEITSFVVTGRYVNGDMHCCYSQSLDLYMDLALASYHQNAICRRIEKAVTP